MTLRRERSMIADEGIEPASPADAATMVGYESHLDIFAHDHRRTAASLARRAGEGGLPPDLDLGRFPAPAPPAGAPCDIVVDAALVYARGSASGGDPLDLARAIARDLSAARFTASVEIAGPGFVNVTLRPAAILGAIASILRGGFGAQGDVGGRARPSDLRSNPPLDEARAIATAEQSAALAAAAGLPFRQDGPDGPARLALGPSSLGRREVGSDRPVAAGGEVAAGIGADAVRFAVASRRHDATLYLDPAALSDRSRENPAFCVPYAHARCRAVLRRAAAAWPAVDLARHAHVVSIAAATRAPSVWPRICATSRPPPILTGTEAKISHNYALLMKKREIQTNLGSDWRLRPPSF